MPLLSWDIWLIKAINGWAGAYTIVDLFFVRFLMLDTVKVVPLMACLVWVWFDDRLGGARRAKLGHLLGGGFLALVVSQSLQTFLPERARPIYTPELDLTHPVGLPDDILHDWSAFPSDNAALAFAIAMGIWRVSRPVGTFAFTWAALVVCLPRIFLGLHYPSDVIGGAVIGIVSVLFVAKVLAGKLLDRPAFERLTQSKPLFYCLLFIVMFEVTTMFRDVKTVTKGLYQYATGTMEFDQP